MHEKQSYTRGPLRGRLTVVRQHIPTGEKSLWYEEDSPFMDNIIPISGYQWTLMKMLGLHLDSLHGVPFEKIDQDTSVVIPDLNNETGNSIRIGIAPQSYTTMEEDISADHFIQGFMVGNGGSGEDNITTKNTDYSFMNLRNPIPFRQVRGPLHPSIAGRYLGKLRLTGTNTTNSFYIKKFDERPNITHSWWRDGQRWDRVDPINQGDLGPNNVNPPRNNRIETYGNISFTIDEEDCKDYFNHEGSGSVALLNELGLVAFDALPGTRSLIERLYNREIKELIRLILDPNRDTFRAPDGTIQTEEGRGMNQILLLSKFIMDFFDAIDDFPRQNTHIEAFRKTITQIATDVDPIDLEEIKTQLKDVNNIGIEDFFNGDGSFIYSTDNFLFHMEDDSFASLTTDEAQRIKLITYYTFRSIPLQKNWRIIVNYRIYAN
jgi:hypothetical protein